MRPVVVSLLLLLFSQPLFAQRETGGAVPEPYSPDWYGRKARRQKLVAYSCVGGGLTMALVGVFMAKPNYRNIYQLETDEIRRRRESRERTGVGLAVGGVGVVAASIPWFLASARNGRLARLNVKRETAYLPDPAMRGSFPALALRFSL